MDKIGNHEEDFKKIVEWLRVVVFIGWMSDGGVGIVWEGVD